MMREAILNFAKQFSYTPRVERPLKRPYETIIVAGMGGSHLSADILKGADPTLPIIIHRDYGLPHVPAAKKKTTLLIASSYSGNTEETIDAFLKAGKAGIDRAAISVGGKLGELARKEKVSYVQMPDTGIQPRSALGFSVKGLLALMKLSRHSRGLAALSDSLRPERIEPAGKKLATTLRGYVPVVYASGRNESIAYNWKIKMNETGKIPAFYNVLPELNHNEMTGFDIKDSIKKLSQNFFVLFLRDEEDDPRIGKRMSVLTRLYKDRGLPCADVPLKGDTRWMRIFSSLVLADWAALYTAEHYGLEAEQVPMVEEFKKLILK